MNWLHVITAKREPRHLPKVPRNHSGVESSVAQVLFFDTLSLFCYLYTTCTLYQIQKILKVYNEKSVSYLS